MKNLSVKLLVTLTLFSIVLITVMSLTTRSILLHDSAVEQAVLQEDIEDRIIMDLETMDNAHHIFQQIETERMEKGLVDLRAYYEQNQDVYAWDLEAIKERYQMDFYILNAEGQVVVTTHEPSKGIDFNDCCSEFVELIQERIQTNQFYYDGLEISVAENDLRMFSYLATADHKYLLEFGIRFDETHVAKKFNYEKTVDSLLSYHLDLDELRVLTYNGFILNNEPNLLTYEDLDPQLQQAFLTAATTNQRTEVVKEFGRGEKVTHRFIPYKSSEWSGTITKRIVYAQYSNISEQNVVQKNTMQFIIMLCVGLVTSTLLLFIILRLLNNTIRLATYDTLTGVYNRASYTQHMNKLIHDRKKYPIGLMLIDLDNFKEVNDLYGHATGDAVLREVASIVKTVIGTNGFVVRFGGDEFAVVYEKNVTPEMLQRYAELLLDEMRKQRTTSEGSYWSMLSMSIGSTIQRHVFEQESQLFGRADQALYVSKDNGKDQHTYIPPDAT